MKRSPRPQQACPICGRTVLVSGIVAHAGSVGCLVTLHRRGRKYSDAVRGPKAERAARELDAVLREARGASA